MASKTTKRLLALFLGAIAAIWWFGGSSAPVNLEATAQELALIEHVVKNGALVRFALGRECATCLRGGVATQNIRKGDLVLALPVNLAVPIPTLSGGRQGFASEYATGLFQRIKREPDFYNKYTLFWETLPRPGEVLAPELWTDDLIDMLHTPELERLIRVHRGVGHSVYYGNASWAEYPNLAETLTGDQAVSMDEFLHMSAIIGSRDFGLSAEASNGEESAGPFYWLIPVADMINHADRPNAARSDNGTHVLMHAVRDIKKGEEVTNNYQEGVVDRNDMALYIYGFIQEHNLEKLCAVDLPSYTRENPFVATFNDPFYYGPKGMWNLPGELVRLEGLLKEAEKKSTIEEDEKLLMTGRFSDWKVEMVVKFRLGRKKALKKAFEIVKREMDGGNFSGHDVEL